MFPDKAGSILYRKKVLMNKNKNMLQRDGIEKTYREKTKLNRNIECKGAYSVAEFVLWKKLGMEKKRMTNKPANKSQVLLSRFL